MRTKWYHGCGEQTGEPEVVPGMPPLFGRCRSGRQMILQDDGQACRHRFVKAAIPHDPFVVRRAFRRAPAAVLGATRPPVAARLTPWRAPGVAIRGPAPRPRSGSPGRGRVRSSDGGLAEQIWYSGGYRHRRRVGVIQPGPSGHIRTSPPGHGRNAGSNPIRDAKQNRGFTRIAAFP